MACICSAPSLSSSIPGNNQKRKNLTITTQTVSCFSAVKGNTREDLCSHPLNHALDLIRWPPG